MGIIFDLDQTIIDSTIAAQLRKDRQWQRVYTTIPKFKIYEGMLDVLQFTCDNNIKTVIVSTSPRTYCEKVVGHIKMKCDHIVGYHDASPIKPHPAPMLKALELLKMKSNKVISIGDRAIDIQSAQKAGIATVGCLWGSDEKEILKNSKPDYLISKPVDFIPIARTFFKL